MYFRPFPLSNDIDTRINAFGDALNNTRVQGGKGIKVTHHNGHTVIQAQTKYVSDATKSPTYYDFSASYQPNDQVVVDASAKYYDQNGNPLNIPAGTYVCLAFIPPAFQTSTFYIANIVPRMVANGQNPYSDHANEFRWYGVNTYFPTNNGSASFVTSSTLNVGGYPIIKQQFWQAVGGTSAAGGYAYDISASYNVGDLVFVDASKTYPISFPPAPSVPTSTGSAPPLCPGTFQCAVAVPSLYNTGSDMVGNWRYPIFPLQPSSSVVVVSGSTYNEMVWFPISPQSLLISLCTSDGGNGFSAYLCGQQVNATYQWQLAYTGSH